MANKDLIINSDTNLEEKIIALLICTGQELSVKLNQNIKPMNLSLTQLNILHVLSKTPNGQLTVNEIKKFMVDESPNVSRSLNKLMENGYIKKQRSEQDQRVVYINITDKGRQIHEDADREVVKTSFNLSNLSHDEKEKLFNLLSKL